MQSSYEYLDLLEKGVFPESSIQRRTVERITPSLRFVKMIDNGVVTSFQVYTPSNKTIRLHITPITNLYIPALRITLEDNCKEVYSFSYIPPDNCSSALALVRNMLSSMVVGCPPNEALDLVNHLITLLKEIKKETIQ